MTFVWKDPVTWQPLVRKTRGVRQTQRSMLLALRATYDSVLVFHGGRPLDVESYYKYGLRIADKQQLTAAAKRIFLSPEFPEINEDAFQEAVSMLSGIHDRVLFVVLDDRELRNDCGHYLIYGSEHICGIAAKLGRNRPRDYRQVLKRFGIPTILRLSLPLEMIEESDLLELADRLRESVPRIRAGRRPHQIDFTFELSRDIPSMCILGHEHPDRIPDPLLPMQPTYVYSTSPTS
jgi:hypothetical protein